MYRILACGEFTQINSGYGVYMKELLTRLSRIPGVEVAEMASFCNPKDSRIANSAWRIYPVDPDPANEQEMHEHHSSPTNTYGARVFNSVLLDFQPTHVIDIRDSWNIEYQFRSPLRKYFSHVVMPAIDAVPQHKEWLEMYSKADKLLSYTDWGIEVLKKAGLKNTYLAASPCAANEYSPVSPEEKIQLKRSLGLGDINIVGTVMRNQRRKLFPDLFRDFRSYLDKSGSDNTYLLCHTSNPDTWDIDQHLLEHGIGNKTLFSYVCRRCKAVDVSFYRGWFSHCDRCNTPNMTFSSTNNGADNKVLNQIYNMMDVYVQYAVCEGYGIPLVEALACSVPIMAVDYSAMSEIVQQANGYPIKVKAFLTEPETARHFALPDGEDFVNKLTSFFALSKEEQANKGSFSRLLYGLRNYDEVTKIWYDAITSSPPQRPWNAPAIRYNDVNQIPNNLSASDLARFIIVNLLQEPELIGSYFEARLIRDINNGHSPVGFDGRYFHEDFSGRPQRLVPFGRDIMAGHLKTLVDEKRAWENKRAEICCR